MNSSTQQSLEVRHPGFSGKIGVARREITPPDGIYSRMWGCALHDVSEGVHRPLTATVMACKSHDADAPLVLASLDLGWWSSRKEASLFRNAVLKALSLDTSQLQLHLTHTHAGPSISREASHKPGGEKIAPYLRSVQVAVIDAAQEAIGSAIPATLDWSMGHCKLAQNRDQPNPEEADRVVGYRPDAHADDTLLVGRINYPSVGLGALLVNYACHPTTLGGANRLISPDYVGAMRDLVEENCEGAPVLFLNGAAGDLAPRRQYLGDPAIADQNGRQLGHAVLSVLNGMLPPGRVFAFERVEDSGAKLGCWHMASDVLSETFSSRPFSIQLDLKPQMPPQELAQRIAECTDRAEVERLERKALFGHGLDGVRAGMPVWLWQLGDAVILGVPAEMHSPFQLALREQFIDRPIVVMNLVSSYYGYLPPRDDYPLETYQSHVSLFQPGCHERMVTSCKEKIEELLDETGTASLGQHAPHWTRT